MNFLHKRAKKKTDKKEQKREQASKPCGFARQGYAPGIYC
jgi:hypothetical protein